MPATLTVKLSGSLLDPAGLDGLAHALDTLETVDPGASVVLVHGGGGQIDEALTRLDEPNHRVDGLRVTSRTQAGVVQATLDELGARLARDLTVRGHPAHHVESIQARLVARVKQRGGDLGRVGTPVAFRTAGLDAHESIPVVTPVGTDGTGPLNVNADEAAAAIAAATDSTHLVLATDVPGVLDAHGAPIEALTPCQAARMVDEGTALGGMQPKLEAARRALADGLEAVHVAPMSPRTLAGVLEDPPRGPGTRVTARREVPA